MKCPVCEKNISETSLRCPYCKTRIGLLCSHCNTVNPLGTLACKNCGHELLKVCPHCGGVNFPNAVKCRKCDSILTAKTEKKDSEINPLEYTPDLYSQKQAFDILSDGLNSKTQKIFSITGDKGIGKTFLLKKVRKSFNNDKFRWCIGECSPLTQLTPGGVIQAMLLDLFCLPNFCIKNDEFEANAIKFFTNEFKFLKQDEISDFLNFLYNFKDGNYEDIIINKKRTFKILSKIFTAFADTAKFVFVIDNFDFIDGFSIEFFTNFIQHDEVWKNLKLIAIYNKHKPVTGFFGFENRDMNAYVDINLAPLTVKELENNIKLTGDSGTYVTEREKEVIFAKSHGNPAFVEQAISYSFDCQISDKAFLMPNTFLELIKSRLETLKKNNNQAYKLLCGASILGNKLNLALLKEIFGYKGQEFNDIMSYLVKSNFVRPYNEIYYEFNNILLWETILKSLTRNSAFEDINIKIGKALSIFTLNTNPTLAMIAHNLKETRMAFDIWTKTTRLASYVGDINLYVISQKQCLALLNEFNENETLNIRYNISERLGKLLTEYDAEEALEFLPDAIANARTENNEVKEIELLGYLSLCCKKTGKYFGNVECVDNVLKKMKPSQEIETALVKTSKLESLLNIGNCGEVINLIDNDIMPVLSNYLAKPKLNKTIPLLFLYDTWIRIHLTLAHALALQGNNRSFEVLNKLFNIIEKHKVNDYQLHCKAKLTLALANTMQGNFETSNNLLEDIERNYKDKVMDGETISRMNLISIINRFMTKQYDQLQEILFESVTFANNTGDNFTKNILKVLLGKMFKDDKKAKHALEIYNEQVTYFAKEKMALGALLSWLLIAEAVMITESPKNTIDIANNALEIAQNPRINNTFFIVHLKMILAQAYMELSDYETAKINLESAVILAKKYAMNDTLSRLYILFGKYYRDLGTVQSNNQMDYLKGSLKMFENAMTIVMKNTHNKYIHDQIDKEQKLLFSYCDVNGFKLV